MRCFTRSFLGSTALVNSATRWCATSTTPKSEAQQPEAAAEAASPNQEAQSSSNALSEEVQGADYPPPEEVPQWNDDMLAKHGSRFHLLRPVYRDLVDEMRHEVYAKPPSPIPGWVVMPRKPHDRWFCIQRVEKDGTEVRVGAPVVLRDPDNKNEVLSIINWYEMYALIKRNGVILEARLANLEAGMQVRNVKVFTDTENDATLMEFTAEGINARENKYDGPFNGHLESYFLQEIYDVLMDHHVDNDVCKYVAEWVFYVDHVQYVQWSLDQIDHLGGMEKIATEGELLTQDEREEFDYQAEEWLPTKKL